MNPRHHISDDLLLDYEAGGMAEGWSLVVATHLALCPQCRQRARAAAAIGGVLMEAADAVAVSDTAFDEVMARIDRGPVVEKPARPVRAATLAYDTGNRLVFPEPLRSYAGGDVDTIRWKSLGTSARHFPIKTADGETSVRLLRIPGGEEVPHHGHRGQEMTLVLAGTLVDDDQIFGRGDVEHADESVEHQPKAGPGEDCICLAVTDAPLRFKSLVARLAQPFLRI